MNISSIVQEYNKTAKREVIHQGVYKENTDRLPTGIFPLDYSLGGGIPMGRVSIFYGPESSAKTSICLQLIANMQRMKPDQSAVFIDVEGHFDKEWAEKMGVDTDKLVYVLPQSAEETIDVAESLLYGEDLSLLVIDSLAAMVTEKELDNTASKAVVGGAGLAINKLYRKVSRAIGVAKMDGLFPTVALINQVRSKVGVLYGDPEVMPGGKAFQYASSLTVRLYGKEEMDDKVHKELAAYRKITAVVKKYKIPIISKKCEFLIALMPIEKLGLEVGQVNSWGFILHFMKNVGCVNASELTWPDTGEVQVFDKQADMKEKYFADAEFAARLRNCVLQLGFQSIG